MKPSTEPLPGDSLTPFPAPETPGCCLHHLVLTYCELHYIVYSSLFLQRSISSTLFLSMPPSPSHLQQMFSPSRKIYGLILLASRCSLCR
ncbi:hypothetical protein DPEC_G00106960, partial [Dallia pectoralis]